MTITPLMFGLMVLGGTIGAIIGMLLVRHRRR
jgi:uncharacterized membrane protein YsdA (DUF1294 family)